MATVQITKPTDMSLIPAIPTDPGGGGGSSFEVDAHTSGISFFLLGSFQPQIPDVYGTVSRALIDLPDFGGFPNLDITGLTFTVNSDPDIISRAISNPLHFVADLLAGDDSIMGSTGSDTIFGFGGYDTINGGLGADSMFGGTGSDIYFVDNVNDSVHETRGTSTDRVFASASWNMTQDSAIEILSTANQAGAEAINPRGNEFSNFVVGNDGQNILSGGLGNAIWLAWEAMITSCLSRLPTLLTQITLPTLPSGKIT
jgi:Ca2+-binding RTX toxin-like protein